MQRPPNYTYPILVLDVVLMLFCISNIPSVVDRPRFPVSSSQLGSQTVVASTDDGSLQSPLQRGDVILDWNGSPVARPEHLEFLADLSSIGDTVRITGTRETSSFTALITLPPFTTSFRFVIIHTLTGLAVFALALFLLSKRPHDPVARLLHFALVALGALVLLTQGRVDASDTMSYFRRAGLFVAYGMAPALFLRWTMLFPIRRFARKLWPGFVVIGSSVVFVVLLIWFHLQAIAVGSAEPFITFQVLYEWFHLYVFTLIVAGLVCLFAGYLQETAHDRKAALRWIFSGILVGAGPFTFLVLLPQAFGPELFISEEFATIFTLAIPVCLTVAFLRYHALHVQVETHRRLASSVVSIMTGIVAILVGLVVGSFFWEGKVFGEDFAPILVVALSIMAFQPVRTSLSRLLEESLYPVRGSLARLLQRSLERSRGAVSPDQLAAAVVEELTSALPGVEFTWARFDHTQLHPLPKEFGPEPIAIALPHAVRAELASGAILARNNSVEGSRSRQSEEGSTWLTAHGFDMSFGVHDETGALLGVVLGRLKKQHGPLKSDESEAALAIALQASESLSRLLLQERVFVEQQERRRADELSRMRSHFVSSVSHELRTPLTSIAMFGEMLQDGRVSKGRRKEYADIIVQESQRLGRMVTNVLNFAKIERGSRDYVFHEIDPLTVIRKAVRTMEAHARMLKAVLKLRAPRRLPHVHGDADALQDVLVNLIGNALKYSTSKKWVRIEVSSKGGNVFIRVRDKGIGIPPDAIPKVFDPFYRVGDPRTSQAGGAGLGLALVKHTIDAHGGTVSVESVIGKGTTVIVSLPLTIRKL